MAGTIGSGFGSLIGKLVVDWSGYVPDRAAAMPHSVA
jgi:hypothetical protein